MTKQLTENDLIEFYYKIFLKYGITSMEQLNEYIERGAIHPDELIMKAEDVLEPDQLEIFKMKLNEMEADDALASYSDDDE